MMAAHGLQRRLSRILHWKQPQRHLIEERKEPRRDPCFACKDDLRSVRVKHPLKAVDKSGSGQSHHGFIKVTRIRSGPNPATGSFVVN
jgi:hypothetical protein